MFSMCRTVLSEELTVFASQENRTTVERRSKKVTNVCSRRAEGTHGKLLDERCLLLFRR